MEHVNTMRKPVICFDFDGTLVDKHGHIHPHDVDILSNEDRVVFIPATGRPLHAVRHAFERNGLFRNQPIPFPMVLQNGAELYRPHEILYAYYPLSPASQARLVEIIQHYPQVTALLFSLAQIELLWPSEAGAAMIRRFDLDTQPFDLTNPGREFAKLTCVASEPTILQALAAETSDLVLERSFSLPTALEITQAGIDKGPMLVNLCHDLGLDQSLIIAAGDGGNDLSMFERAALSFSPTTSPAAIRAQADYEIDVAQTGLLPPILKIIGL